MIDRPLPTTACAALVFGLLAGVPAHAQELAVNGTAINAGTSIGPTAPPAAPRSRSSEQAAGSAEKAPDAARFGEAAGPPSLAVGPEKLCAALTPAAAIPPAWQRSALPDESWECFAERAFEPADGGGSLFAILRGRSQTRVDGFRLKLNLPEEGGGQKAQAAATAQLKSVFAALGRIFPLPLRTALADRVPLRRTIGGMAIDLRQEFGPVARYNVIIDFAQPPGNQTSVPVPVPGD